MGTTERCNVLTNSFFDTQKCQFGASYGLCKAFRDDVCNRACEGCDTTTTTPSSCDNLTNGGISDLICNSARKQGFCPGFIGSDYCRRACEGCDTTSSTTSTTSTSTSTSTS